MHTTCHEKAALARDWTLDGRGNFAKFKEDSDGGVWDLEQTRTVNAANEITGIDEGQYQDAWITPEYDAAGNMIVGPAPGDETARLHFVYDAWNRLVKVYADDAQNPGEPGDVVAQYTYDGQKRRIEKTLADGTSIEYYYNANWQLLEERFLDESQEPTGADQYVWSPRYIDAPILRDRYDAEGELDAAARLYYLGDANFNVTALVGLEEVEPDVFEWQVTERYAYDPYGKAVVYDADWANPTAPTTDGPLYAGYRFDAETGLHIARHRLYHSTLSTWITRDPLGYAAGDVNLYAYGASNAINALDPYGLKWEWGTYYQNIWRNHGDPVNKEGAEYIIMDRWSMVYFFEETVDSDGCRLCYRVQQEQKYGWRCRDTQSYQTQWRLSDLAARHFEIMIRASQLEQELLEEQERAEQASAEGWKWTAGTGLLGSFVHRAFFLDVAAFTYFAADWQAVGTNLGTMARRAGQIHKEFKKLYEDLGDARYVFRSVPVGSPSRRCGPREPIGPPREVSRTQIRCQVMPTDTERPDWP